MRHVAAAEDRHGHGDRDRHCAASPRTLARRGRSTTPCPTRSAGCWSCSASSHSPVADEVFATSRWLALAGAAVSVPMWFPQLQPPARCRPASGSPRCPRSRSASSSPARSGCWRFGRSPPDGYVGQAVRPAGLGLRPGRRTPGGGDRRRGRAARDDRRGVSTLVNVAFVYFLFRVHRREWLGGPGPLEVHPRPAARRNEKAAHPRKSRGDAGLPRCETVSRSGRDHVEVDLASTSSCSLTVTVCAPSDLIGLPTTMVRLSTSPPPSVIAAAMSPAVTAPKSRPPSPARTLTLNVEPSSLAFTSAAWSASRTARASRDFVIDSMVFSPPRVQRMPKPRGMR